VAGLHIDFVFFADENGEIAGHDFAQRGYFYFLGLFYSHEWFE
jgi:hypothetical protein